MIILKRQNDGLVTATYTPNDAEYSKIITLFGQDTIPTAYSLEDALNHPIRRGSILRTIEKLNPASVVAWEGEGY